MKELRQDYSVADLARLTGLPRSSFYYAEKHPHKEKYQQERELVQQIYHENKGRYGYRRITLAFRNRGLNTNHKVIQKLMHEEHIVCQVRLHRYNSYKGQVGKIAKNLLLVGPKRKKKRDFSTTKSNQKWVTDVTQFNIMGKKLYLSPILDLHDQSLISWNLSESPNFAQTMDMLDKAFEKIPDGTNLILHSDQGWQYQMYEYQQRLKDKGIRQSMSRKANCLDNSVMENFFGLLKSELLYLKHFDSVE
ncbi:MAG: IS3 family transposase, partial [archaeon]|nr:IS3 family transposase [archaeon]